MLVLKHVLAHFTLHHILNYVKHYMLKLIMYSHHIYEKHVLPIPRVYIGSWIAHIELQVIRFISYPGIPTGIEPGIRVNTDSHSTIEQNEQHVGGLQPVLSNNVPIHHLQCRHPKAPHHSASACKAR